MCPNSYSAKLQPFLLCTSGLGFRVLGIPSKSGSHHYEDVSPWLFKKPTVASELMGSERSDADPKPSSFQTWRAYIEFRV